MVSKRLGKFDPKQLERDIGDAEEQVLEAVLADPVWQAVMHLGLAQRRLRDRWVEAGASGHPPTRFSPIGFQHLVSVAEGEADRIAQEEADARAAAADPAK